jgi:outer membrane protein assembly factor BamD (BamD/ComL family)
MIEPLQLTGEVWLMMGFTVVAFWGIAVWALVCTLGQEDRKVELLESQDRIDSYSPRALADLREFAEGNPNDPYAEDARRRYNKCVETLKRTEGRFYDWSDEEVADLERL